MGAAVGEVDFRSGGGEDAERLVVEGRGLVQGMGYGVAAGAGFGAVAVVDGVPLQAPVNIGAWIVPAGIPFAVSVGPNMGATATMFVLALGGYV